MLLIELGEEMYIHQKERIPNLMISLPYVLQTEFSADSLEESVVVEGVSFISLGLRLASKETVSDGYLS